MLFVFLDDGTLDIVENLEHAQRKYEAIDVENNEYIFYDDNGNQLKPTIISIARKTKLFGFIPQKIELKSFHLSLLNEEYSHKNSIYEAVSRVTQVNPNKWFTSLEDVKNYFLTKPSYTSQL